MPPPQRKSSGHQCVDAFTTAFAAAQRIPMTEALLNKPEVQRRLATVAAFVEGTPPGVVGQIANDSFNFHAALSRITTEEINTNGVKLEQLFNKELPNLKYIGPAKGAGAAKAAPQEMFLEFPDYFAGASPELKRLNNLNNQFREAKFKLAEGLGYPITKAKMEPGQRYISHLWEPEDVVPTSMTSPIHRTAPGKVSVAKEREFNSIIEGVAAGRSPQPVAMRELLAHSSTQMDRAISDAFERRLILERFGQKGPGKGLVEFNDPLYKGWYANPEIVNFVDQIHAPATSVLSREGVQSVAGAASNTVFGTADVGVFGVHVLRELTTGGLSHLAYILNRSLAAVGGPHYAEFLGTNIEDVMRLNVDGLVINGGPQLWREGAGTMVQYIPKVGAPVDKQLSRVFEGLANAQFQHVLTPLRIKRAQGDLIILKLLGRDIENPAVRRTAMDWANAATGASRGAMTQGRRTGESVLLTSFQMARAEAAAWLKLSAKLVDPRTTAEERILGLTALTSMAATVYGLGSAINMAQGYEPVDWDPRKSDWATIRAGGLRIPLIPQRSLMRAIGKSVTAAQELDPALAGKAWEQYATAKLSPLPQALASGILGVGFDQGKGFRQGDLSMKGRAINALPLPPIVETALDKGERDPVALGLSFGGLNPFPVSNYDKGREAFQEKYGRPYNPETDRRIAERDFPELFPLSDEKKNLAEKRVEYAQDLAPSLALIQKGQPAPDLLDAYKDYQNKMVGANDLAYIDADFADPKTKAGKALQEYRTVKLAVDPDTGEKDWATFDRERAAALAKLPKEVAQEIQDRLQLPPEYADVEKKLKAAKSIRSKLYDIPKLDGIPVDRYQKMQQIWSEASALKREAAKQGDELDSRDAIWDAGAKLRMPDAVTDDAYYYRSGTKAAKRAANPAYDEYLADNYATLSLFYPSLYGLERLRDLRDEGVIE